MSWLNFNDSLNSIKGQLSTFANTVLADEKLETENNGEAYGESVIVRENKNDGFDKEEDNWRWSTDESKTDQLKTDETITNLKKKILELENENRDLISSLDKLEQNHEENNGELIKIKNKLKEELETVTEKYEVLNMRYNKLALAENGYKKRLNDLKNKCDNLAQQKGVIEQNELEEKIVQLETTNEELKKTLNDTNLIIDSKLLEMESNVNRLETENKALKISLQMYKDGSVETQTIKEEYEAKIKNLENQLTGGNQDKIHKQYLTVLNEQFSEYFKIPLDDYKNSNSFELTFVDSVKNISNLLKNYETKFALMESRIFELTQNKTDIQNEKNQEIEKLLQNSEMLTQELLKKTKEIKDLETECTQLMKNNDLLIGKLEENKENGLQTIFESNEENVDSLEKEVECANQKIDELQHKLSECQSISGGKSGEIKENETLRKIINDLEIELETTKSERDNCRILIDKMRLDFETTEYQFSEMNVNLETLSEEIEKHKEKIDTLILENNNLKCSKTSEHEETKIESKRLIKYSENLEERIKEFETKIQNELQNKDNIIEKITKNLNKLQEKQKEFPQLKDFYGTLCAELQIDADLNQETFSTILQQISGLKIDIKNGAIENSQEKLQASLKYIQKELQDVTNQRDLIFTDLESYKKELQDVKQSRNDLQASLEISKKDLENVTLSRNELWSSLENVQKQLQDTTSQKNETLLILENCQKELQDVIETKHKLEVSLENAQSKLQALMNSENESSLKLQNMTAMKNELQVSFENAQKELQEVTETRNQLEVALENSQQKLQALLNSENESSSLSNKDLDLQNMTALKNELQVAFDNAQQELQYVTASKNELQISLENALKKLHEVTVSGNDAMLKNVEKELQDMTASKNKLQASFESSQKELQDMIESKRELQTSLENTQKELQDLMVYKNALQESLETTQKQLQDVMVSGKELQESFKESQKELQEVAALKNELQVSLETIRKELQDVTLSRNELITIVQTKHQETLTYHAEIQRLSEILRKETEKNIHLESRIESLEKSTLSTEILQNKNEEIEKMNDQIVFLREKCNVMAQNILDEQRKNETFIEKEATLNKNLERLQNHLMEVEEHYTQELLQSEGKMALLQAKLNEVEQREKDSSTVYTSVSIRANQQNEALQQQLQSTINQRDELKKKLMEIEDENNVKTAALSNLQLVLEQFQKDKEGDVIRETERIRRQLKHEQKIQDDLRNEITNLETQIKENKQGLQAALRLADQLEMSKSQISNLREEITVLTEKLTKKEEELKTISSQTDGKIDKSLIKNLVIGFVTSNNKLNKDQLQILKIIATVLDFNEQEHNKVNLNQTQQSNWLKTILMPISGDDAPTYESLSRAFVNFLENESKPRVVPSLLPQNSEESNVSTSSSTSSTRSTPQPIVLNEIVLPTFSDFPQHRNSSSILKGVLKDNP